MQIPYHSLSEQEFATLIKDGSNALIVTGNGLSDINIFKSHKRHLTRGDGALSNIFSKYGHHILPLLQRYIFPAAKQFGKDVAMDVLSGNTSLKGSLKTRGKESLKKLGKRVLSGEGGGAPRKKRRLAGTTRKRKITPSRVKRGSRKTTTRRAGTLSHTRARRPRRPLGRPKGVKTTLKRLGTSKGRSGKGLRKGTLLKKRSGRVTVTGRDCTRPKNRGKCYRDIFAS